MIFDEPEPYAYYPNPVDDRSVGYDELMAKVEDGHFMGIIAIPDREAVYWMSCEVQPHSELLNVEDDTAREYVLTKCIYALGVRVESALRGG